MSGFCGPDLKEHAGAVQARAILLKPLKCAQLAQCLAATFAQPARAQPALSIGAHLVDAIDGS